MLWDNVQWTVEVISCHLEAAKRAATQKRVTVLNITGHLSAVNPTVLLAVHMPLASFFHPANELSQQDVCFISTDSSILKRPKRTRTKGSVRFDSVTVFLFQTCQGFTSVPSRGGCTLGMVRWHSSCQRYSLAEHGAEQRRQRREKLTDRLKDEKLEAFKQRVSCLLQFHFPRYTLHHASTM